MFNLFIYLFMFELERVLYYLKFRHSYGKRNPYDSMCYSLIIFDNLKKFNTDRGFTLVV